MTLTKTCAVFAYITVTVTILLASVSVFTSGTLRSTTIHISLVLVLDVVVA